MVMSGLLRGRIPLNKYRVQSYAASQGWKSDALDRLVNKAYLSFVASQHRETPQWICAM